MDLKVILQDQENLSELPAQNIQVIQDQENDDGTEEERHKKKTFRWNNI